MRSRRAALLLALGASLLLIGGLANTAWFTNLWLGLTDKEYVVPAESSVFSFTPTVMNPGSGGWWLYGEDRENFYHFLGQPDRAYLKISRSAARDCKGFDPHDRSTWCA